MSWKWALFIGRSCEEYIVALLIVALVWILSKYQMNLLRKFCMEQNWKNVLGVNVCYFLFEQKDSRLVNKICNLNLVEEQKLIFVDKYLWKLSLTLIGKTIRFIQSSEFKVLK